MSAINLGKGLGLLWEGVASKGVSLSESVTSLGKEVIKRTNSSRPSSSMGMRRTHSFGFSSPSKLSNVRYYSTSQGRGHGMSHLSSYKNLTNPEKVHSLTYNGLRMVGANVPFKINASEEDVQEAWEEVRSLHHKFPAFTSGYPALNLAILAEQCPPFDPRVQSKHIVEDVDEAVLLEGVAQQPESMLLVPFGADATEDSEVGKRMLADFVQPETFFLEDGCGNGQHLISFVGDLREQDIPVKALGTDIVYYSTNLGRMAASSAGMEESVSFSAGHALHRSSPRVISGMDGQHITLAYRVIPVFNEQKILRYMEKISEDMQSGDLWCGSIALPEGRFYERNTGDQQAIQNYSIRSIPTSFGGTTFVHRPNFGNASDAQLVQHFNAGFGDAGLQSKEEDFSSLVLNTYMTKEQFESLAKKYGLQLEAEPMEVDCGDNKRLVVLLKKV